MKPEQIEKMCKETMDKDYQEFLVNCGWKYHTETEAADAYGRQERSKDGIPLTLAEFLTELGAEQTDVLGQQLYTSLLALLEKKALTAFELYQYAKFGWCRVHPEAVAAYPTGPHTWKVNNCDTEVSEDWARLTINSEWGFEASRIKVLGTPYYDSTDWNYICFSCGPCDWLMANGGLYQIYQ